MPDLPSGLDPTNITDHYFIKGWVACYEKLKNEVKDGTEETDAQHVGVLHPQEEG